MVLCNPHRTTSRPTRFLFIAQVSPYHLVHSKKTQNIKTKTSEIQTKTSKSQQTTVSYQIVWSVIPKHHNCPFPQSSGHTLWSKLCFGYIFGVQMTPPHVWCGSLGLFFSSPGAFSSLPLDLKCRARDRQWWQSELPNLQDFFNVKHFGCRVFVLLAFGDWMNVEWPVGKKTRASQNWESYHQIGNLRADLLYQNYSSWSNP